MCSIKYFALLFILLISFSCKKKKVVEEPVVSENLSKGMIVLCEGLFQQNNSSVSWINLTDGSVNNTFFEQRSGRALGDTGNDMQKYGGKIYILVNVSSTIEVMDASTFKAIKQIQMLNGATSKQPRSLAFHGSKVYVSCYDGFVDVIDTVSLTVVNRIQVGANPEGLAVSNNKLYVANSGGLNFPNPDSTVSVIDLSTQTELYKLTVGMNPGSVKTDQNGDVYVISRGDYNLVPSRMVRINSTNDAVDQTFSFDASGISSMNDKFLIFYYDFNTQNARIGLFDPNSESMINSDFIDLSNVTTMYGVQYEMSNGTIYVMDAMNFTNSGYVRAFDENGNYQTSYHVGLNPSKILFYE